MSARKLQVFLASRFDEFADLRVALRERINKVRRPEVEAVDLNDNLTDPHPPLVRCYEAVDRAEVVVLLVGEAYGQELEGHGGSYTHLEYRHALEDHSKIILPFLVTVSHLKSPDPRLREWVKEIMRNHCASRLDPALGADRLASDIFEAVYERLWEIAAEGDAPRDDAVDDDESARGWDESPIKRDQLIAKSRQTDWASHPLKVLAADHSIQAFDALALNMPETAIHQLRKAVDLSPLEIVPAYWLARLLIATGRIPDCREGLRLALRCARVAAQREDGPDLASMASLILAARASERLYDREGALQYAKAAHDETPFHWLAKVELGRQYALNGRPDEALWYADQAFWLRPDAIHKIQSDPAYRDLGQPFEGFRKRLRDRVQSETKEILDVEATLRDIAATRRAGAAESIPRNPEPDDDRKLSLLSIVRLARLSSRRGLEFVREWAAGLVGEVKSFAAGRFSGLTQLTREQILQSVESETANVASLKEKLRTDKELMARTGQQTFITAAIGLVLVIALGGGIWNSASNAEWSIFAGLVVLLVLVLLGFGAGCQSTWSRHEAAAKNCTRLEAQLLQAETTLASFVEARRQFDLHAEEVREETRLFCLAVNAFEAATAERLPFAPAVPRRRANATDIIRIDDTEAARDGVVVDRDLLPADLKYLLTDGSAPKATHWFARRVGSGTPDVLNRSLAYFSSPMA